MEVELAEKQRSLPRVVGRQQRGPVSAMPHGDDARGRVIPGT